MASTSKTIIGKVRAQINQDSGDMRLGDRYTDEELTKAIIRRDRVAVCTRCSPAVVIAPAYLIENHNFHNHYTYG